MLGAIAGDVIGSIHEHAGTKTRDFPLFHPACHLTDDTVLTVAIARSILSGISYRDSVLTLGRANPGAGYGGNFRKWLASDEPEPYGSWGNGSAMRVSPIGLAYPDEETVLAEAAASAAITHDHPEGIKGAQAVALAVFLARHGISKEGMRTELQSRFGYDLQRSCDEIRPSYGFDVSCQGSVPEAIVSFLDAEDPESAIRNAVSLGGDADTLAAIAGAIAEAFFGDLPPALEAELLKHLPLDFIETIERFYERFWPERLPRGSKP